ncbi:unnamed protein product [Rotaria sp. Silwood2]|nr:unnamed protein product [Rotaria sp. Silwood2]CAF2757978.1 unnamed protein product [Rotaria sp. Silwood2]CAF3161873.1 unnamed protein product [Rotaria sp. Silwood2]CAF4479378.1 unnamed protein product [Rotaria sp. Silwood2]CAF4506804.1 unnamed protein product [Rotaria sp. Silwood2]
MTSAFLVPSLTWLSCTNDYIDEIHNIFCQHWLNLDKEREIAIDSIDKWCLGWEKRIKKYANEQKVLLNNNYDRLRYVFDKKHKENVETANAYHNTQQLELFNELRHACQELEFQAVRLEYCKKEMEYPKVIDIEEREERTQLEQVDTDTLENARRRRRRCKENDKTENTSSTSVSSSPNSITSSSKQTNNQQTSDTQSKRKDDQLTDTKNTSKKQGKNDNDSNDKCPICFMIFPSNLTRSDRNRHVNEHIIDDHND